MRKSEEEAFQAVIENPENAFCRLEYARAVASIEPLFSQYIRMSLRRPARDHRGEEYLRGKRISLALTMYERRYTTDRNRPLNQFPVKKKCYGGGFVEFIWMGAAEFLQNAEEIYRCAPILGVRLEGVKPVCRELAASPHLARLRVLDLRRNQLVDEDIRVLTESPYLKNLNTLNLSRNNITRAGLETLYAAETLPKVKNLSLWSNPDPLLNPGLVDDDMMVTGSWFEPFVAQLQQKYGDRAWLYPPIESISRSLIFNNL